MAYSITPHLRQRAYRSKQRNRVATSAVDMLAEVLPRVAEEVGQEKGARSWPVGRRVEPDEEVARRPNQRGDSE